MNVHRIDFYCPLFSKFVNCNISVGSQLLGPEDMVNPHVDELSMMTYLSQFPEAKLQPGAPIKARGDPTKVSNTCLLSISFV